MLLNKKIVFLVVRVFLDTSYFLLYYQHIFILFLLDYFYLQNV